MCCAHKQLLMFNQNIFEISSVGRSTYTYKSVNCVNVYGRDVNFKSSNKLGRVNICYNKLCAFWWQAGTMCVYCEFVCFDI